MTGIAAFALGLSAARSIRGQTWAGDNVVFEPTNPVVPTAPLIAVYAGRGRSLVGDRALDFAAEVRLHIEVILPPTVTAEGLTFNTEASQALVFALIWRQIVQALQVQQGPWPDVFRGLLLRTTALDADRQLVEAAKGQKIPVAAYEIHGETIADPPIGVAASGVWADVLAAMAGDSAEVAALAPLLASQILGAGSVLPDWQVAMGALGMTNAETQAIGLGPAVALNTTDAVDLADGAPVRETVTVPAEAS